MAIFALSDELSFPPVHLANKDGLLAMGGDLNPERLLAAYAKGIFPWYEQSPILWWSPNPRFVLFPEEFKISKSLKPLLKKNYFKVTTNQAFEEVIQNCQAIKREGQDGTWIGAEVMSAYVALHKMGWAHSVEVWQQNQLVGGLYGIKMNRIFFGESMFSKVSQASRFGFARYVDLLLKDGVVVIDCQIYSEYLESMGARMIEGKAFSSLLQKYGLPGV